MQPPTPASENTLRELTRLMDGYLSTQLVYTAVQLGIPDALAAGPRTAEQLAADAGVDAVRLSRVLRGLVMEGVLEQLDDAQFGLSEIGSRLRSDLPGSVRGAVIARGGVYYGPAAGLLAAVRDGGSALQQVHGVSLFDYLARDPEMAREFDASMASRSAQEAGVVLSAYDFGRFARLVDVGGGTGLLLAAVLQATPGLRGALFDLPDVVENALPVLREGELHGRCEVVGGDFFAAVPDGGDDYILSRIIHDWDDASAVRILDECRRAIQPSGTLLLVESVLGERVQDNPGAVRMDLHMLTLLGGRERTAAEYASLLAEAGFELQRVIPTASPSGVCVIEAKPV